MIHQNLKPKNIFLTPKNKNNEHITILDFNTSKLLNSTNLQTKTTTIISTPMYITPKQTSTDNNQMGPHTNQFALTLIIYEMLNNKTTFDKKLPTSIIYQIVHKKPTPLSKLVANLPKNTITTIEKTLQKKKKNQFENITAFYQTFYNNEKRIVHHTINPILPPTNIKTTNTLKYKKTEPTSFNKNQPIIIIFILMFTLITFIIINLTNKSGN